jgi:benzodiazapine receptor
LAGGFALRYQPRSESDLHADQFGMRNLPLAAADILVVWATIIWCIVAVWPHFKWVAIAQGPYFLWVSLATVLQLSITWMNR